MLQKCQICQEPDSSSINCVWVNEVEEPFQMHLSSFFDPKFQESNQLKWIQLNPSFFQVTFFTQNDHSFSAHSNRNAHLHLMQKVAALLNCSLLTIFASNSFLLDHSLRTTKQIQFNFPFCIKSQVFSATNMFIC